MHGQSWYRQGDHRTGSPGTGRLGDFPKCSEEVAGSLARILLFQKRRKKGPRSCFGVVFRKGKGNPEFEEVAASW